MISNVKMRIRGGGMLLAAEYAVLCHLQAHANQICDRQSIISAIGITDGRSLDSHVASIRKSLGRHAYYLVSGRGVGYGWVGPTIPCDPVLYATTHERDPLVRLAVKTQAEVAEQLGLSLTEIRLIEREAMQKLSKNETLKLAFKEYLREAKSGYHYNPFYQAWLQSSPEDTHE